MFETATLSYGPPAKRVWATAMGFTGQAMLIGCALLAPLVSPQTLGRAFLVTALAPPTAPPAPPPPGPKMSERAANPAATQVVKGIVTLPAYVPKLPAIIIDEPPEAAGGGSEAGSGVIGGMPNGVSEGIVSHVMREGARLPVVPPLPEAVARPPVKVVPEPVKPPRVTQLRMATPIRRVDPVYPLLARQARVAGTVELLGVLGTDGRIHELKVLHGHPLLINAALEAVRQWVYEPTMLNGQAVEVAAPIMVNFILN